MKAYPNDRVEIRHRDLFSTFHSCCHLLLVLLGQKRQHLTNDGWHSLDNFSLQKINNMKLFLSLCNKSQMLHALIVISVYNYRHKKIRKINIVFLFGISNLRCTIYTPKIFLKRLHASKCSILKLRYSTKQSFSKNIFEYF